MQASGTGKPGLSGGARRACPRSRGLLSLGPHLWGLPAPAPSPPGAGPGGRCAQGPGPLHSPASVVVSPRFSLWGGRRPWSSRGPESGAGWSRLATLLGRGQRGAEDTRGLGLGGLSSPPGRHTAVAEARVPGVPRSQGSLCRAPGPRAQSCPRSSVSTRAARPAGVQAPRLPVGVRAHVWLWLWPCWASRVGLRFLFWECVEFSLQNKQQKRKLWAVAGGGGEGP